MVSDKRHASNGRSSQHKWALPAHGVFTNFFDITKDTKAILRDTEIMQAEYPTVMNTYPTTFLSLADAGGDKSNIVMQMKSRLLKEYKKNKQVLENIDIFGKPAYDVILRGTLDIQNDSLKDVVSAISFLMTKCHQYYGERIMLFTDGWALPIQGAIHCSLRHTRRGFMTICEALFLPYFIRH